MTYRGDFMIVSVLPLRQRVEGLFPLHPGDGAVIPMALVHSCFARSTIAQARAEPVS
jgi:hypothetical protein